MIWEKGIGRKFSKRYLVLYLGLIILAWILYAFSTDGPDYHVYEAWYNYTDTTNAVITRFEIGFSTFLFICVRIGISYQQTLMLLSGIGFILISFSLLQYCKRPILAFLLYMFYPFIFDVVQIRNFISFAIVFFSIRYLRHFSKKNLVLYIALIILATSFHTSSIFYLFFLTAYMKEYKSIVRLSVLTAILIVGVSLIAPSFFYRLLNALGNEIYLESGSTYVKIIGYGLFALLAIVLMYLYHFNDSSTLRIENNDIDVEKEYLCKLIPALLITCVAIGVSSQAYRLFRNMSIIIYIVFLNDGVTHLNTHVIKGRSINILNTAYALFFSIFFNIRQISFWSPLYEEMTKKVIESNSFFFH